MNLQYQIKNNECYDILFIIFITFPYFEKSCFKSVAFVIDDRPLTQILRTKEALFFFAKINLKKRMNIVFKNKTLNNKLKHTCII